MTWDILYAHIPVLSTETKIIVTIKYYWKAKEELHTSIKKAKNNK